MEHTPLHIPLALSTHPGAEGVDAVSSLVYIAAYQDRMRICGLDPTKCAM